jgi:transcriptional regulator with XRE-family HTH domain
MTKKGGWPPSGFGQQLRALREQLGFSQAQLAEAAGCHRFTVAKMERGLQEPAWRLVLALCLALGVPCTAFTGDSIPSEARGSAERKVDKKSQDEPAAPKGNGKRRKADA